MAVEEKEGTPTDQLTERMESIKRRSGVSSVVDGKLVVEWPNRSRSTVGFNKVSKGMGKGAAHPRG